MNKELQLSLEAAGPGLGETRSAASSGQEGAAVSYATSVHVTVPPPEVLGELGDALQQMLKMKVRSADGSAGVKWGHGANVLQRLFADNDVALDKVRHV